MTITAQYLVKEAQVVLQDVAGTRWPASDLVTYLNDAQRDLVVARPDANAVTAAMSLIAGSEQTLTTAAVALIDIPRNSAGNKRAIRKVEVEHLDAINRDWRSMTGVTEIAHFIFDDRDPRTFEVYPPAAASGASVEVIYGAYPTDVSAPSGDGKAYTTVSGNISVKDQWATALLNYMLSRAYSKDSEAGGNVQLATSYMQAFAGFTGVQIQAATAVAPKN